MTATVTIAARRLGLDRNPLRRRSDVVEAAVRIAVVALSVLALPLAIWFGAAIHARVAGQLAHQVATRTAWPATVIDEPAADPAHAPLARPTAVVAWTTAGVRHTATAAVPPDAKAGSTFTLWTTADGRPVAAPMRRSTPMVYAVFAGAGLEAAALVAAVMTLALVREVLDRRRYRQWGAEWSRLQTDQHR